MQAANRHPALQRVFTTFNVNVPSYRADIDRQKPDDLNHIFVRSATGERIPLSEFVLLEREAGPAVVSRFGVYLGAQFQGGPAPGYSSGQAIAAMEQLVKDTLGEGWGMGWTGTAYQETTLGNAALQADHHDLLCVHPWHFAAGAGHGCQ